VVLTDLRYGFIAGRRRWLAWRSKPVAPSAIVRGARGSVVGVAKAIDEALTGPFTDQPSVFHEVIRAEGKKTPHGRTVFHETFRNMSTVPFEVVGDDGSRLLVEPTIAVHSLLPEYIVPTEGHRWTEARIAPGERVVVYGMVDETGAIDTSGYRAEAITIPRIRGTIEEPLVISRAKTD